MGKTVVITGSPAGVGRGCAHAFAHNGYDVGLLARSWTGPSAAEEGARATSVRAVALRVGVTDNNDGR